MMKKLMVLCAAVVFAASAAFGQASSAESKKVEAKIIALEREGWQAFKDRNVAWFRANTSEQFLSISADGVSNKAEVLKATPTECKVKSFSLDHFQFVMLADDVVMLTYTAKQDAVCNGKKAPSAVRAVVNYVKRGDRWLEAVYMQAP